MAFGLRGNGYGNSGDNFGSSNMFATRGNSNGYGGGYNESGGYGSHGGMSPAFSSFGYSNSPGYGHKSHGGPEAYGNYSTYGRHHGGSSFYAGSNDTPRGMNMGPHVAHSILDWKSAITDFFYPTTHGIPYNMSQRHQRDYARGGFDDYAGMGEGFGGDIGGAYGGRYGRDDRTNYGTSYGGYDRPYPDGHGDYDGFGNRRQKRGIC
mmetsp:Transcript_21021/g.56050  ORF Transcript_21021/g.56050 Transcript_21021/m.56050 type:complete len:207 (-) Transcript_21021:347-967(-)